MFRNHEQLYRLGVKTVFGAFPWGSGSRRGVVPLQDDNLPGPGTGLGLLFIKTCMSERFAYLSHITPDTAWR
jgi:hypothetical protein